MDTEKLKKLCEKAAPGPWETLDRRVEAVDKRRGMRACGDRYPLICNMPDRYAPTQDNAAFIAAAREALPALLEKAERLEREIAEEKRTRINYQGIVYEACNALDRAFNRSVRGGEGTTNDMVVPDIKYLNRLWVEAIARAEEAEKKAEKLEVALKGERFSTERWKELLKEAERQRDASQGRIAQLEEALRKCRAIAENEGEQDPSSVDIPMAMRHDAALTAIYDYTDKTLATPSAASEVLRAREALACIVMNAKIGPDAAMNGTTDCYHVPLDDIDAAREILSKEGK